MFMLLLNLVCSEQRPSGAFEKAGAECLLNGVPARSALAASLFAYS
jgi:hypothetical protein